jgi:soluble lytic murein transglycosylase-like protein
MHQAVAGQIRQRATALHSAPSLKLRPEIDAAGRQGHAPPGVAQRDVTLRCRLTAVLLCAGLAALSGAEITPKRALPTQLPPVGAAPPSLTQESVPADAARVPAPSASSSQLEEATSPASPDGEVERILAALESRHTGMPPHELPALARTIVAEAQRNEMDASLVMAVIHVESAFFHRAVSPVGALGLMQLLPSTAEELAQKLDQDWRGPDSLFDPVLNVTLGIAYLKELSDRYESVPHALAAYNWGPGRIDRRIRDGSGLPEIYVKQVMKAVDSAAKLRS